MRVLAQYKTRQMSKAIDNQCKYCGKFLSYKQLEDKKDVMHIFIPDTIFEEEKSYWVHKACWQKNNRQ